MLVYVKMCRSDCHLPIFRQATFCTIFFYKTYSILVQFRNVMILSSSPFPVHELSPKYPHCLCDTRHIEITSLHSECTTASQEIKKSHIKPSYWVLSRNKMNSLLFPFFTQWFAIPGWNPNDTKMFQGNPLENNLFAFPISFALSVNWLWKSSILSFLEKRKRVDLICEHQHPTTSKCCLTHRPEDLRTTIQKSERERI